MKILVTPTSFRKPENKEARDMLKAFVRKQLQEDVTVD